MIKLFQISGLISELSLRLAKSANLSDLSDKSAARSSLDVYQKTQVYTQTEVDAIISGLSIPDISNLQVKIDEIEELISHPGVVISGVDFNFPLSTSITDRMESKIKLYLNGVLINKYLNEHPTAGNPDIECVINLPHDIEINDDLRVIYFVNA